MRINPLLCFALLAAAGTSLRTFGFVDYIQDRRIAISEGSLEEDPYSYYNEYTPVPLFSNWTNGSFRSALGATNLSAQGSSYAYSDYDWSRDLDTFDVTFSIPQTTMLDLAMDLYAQDYNYGEGRASVNLYSGDTTANSAKVFGVEVAAEYDMTQPYTNFSESIPLDSGTYRLEIKAFTYWQEAYSSFNVQGTFTATHTTNGTPLAWMDGYNLADDSLDQDGDGMDTWKEYIAATDPTNGLSVFSVAYSPTNSFVSMDTETERIYGLEASTNLVTGGWQPITNNIPGTGLPIDVPVDATVGAQSFRGTVRMP